MNNAWKVFDEMIERGVVFDEMNVHMSSRQMFMLVQ